MPTQTPDGRSSSSDLRASGSPPPSGDGQQPPASRETKPTPPPSSTRPAVSSSWADPEADGEITLTDANGRTRHLSRVDALRLAARLRTVVKGNRALDEKLKELHENVQ